MPASDKRTVFVCAECGETAPRWEGRCRWCGAWNSLTAEMVSRRASREPVPSPAAPSLVDLTDVPGRDEERCATGLAEFDRVLGGGLVAGSVVLLAGAPGVGKSTLLLQASAWLARSQPQACRNQRQRSGTPVLYVCGEESPTQIKLRANRLRLDPQGVALLSTSEIEAVVDAVDRLHPALLVIDSIQTVVSTALDTIAGSVSQIQACARAVIEVAKRSGVPVVMTGHVTKEGGVAGPRLLEHAVDVVLELTGDGASTIRLLHGTKNRFGPTDEVGVFEMQGTGLSEIRDPSHAFLAHRVRNAPGSALATVLEGTRPITVEVQALTTPSNLPTPRRVATGIDSARLHLILAVLGRRLRLPVGSQDVIVNVPGGLRIRDTGADLALAFAVASSIRDRSVKPDLCAAAEIGLAGELRPVPQAERRVADASRFGVCQFLLASPGARVAKDDSNRVVYYARSLEEALEMAMLGRM